MARIESLPSGQSFGEYLLTDLIAAGRMAEVYKAKRDGVEGFQKILVVKKIYESFSNSPQFVDVFVEEAKRTVSLSHANIVQVLDLGEKQGAYFLAMEYVAGYDLASILKLLRTQNGTFPVELAVFTVSEVAKGLDYAHRRKDYNFQSLNIVHRDMAPANVLISFEGEVKIGDFGISKALESLNIGDTRREMLYASPEQARGDALTPLSDIFSLGLILYELIAGQHPYDDPNPEVIRSRALEGIIPPLPAHVRIPDVLRQILDAMLARNPNDRVESAGTLFEELISCLFALGHKTDSRTLSSFLEKLRPHEERVFQDGGEHLRPPAYTTGSFPAVPQPSQPAPSPHTAPNAYGAQAPSLTAQNPRVPSPPPPQRVAPTPAPIQVTPLDGFPLTLGTALGSIQARSTGGAFLLAEGLGKARGYVVDRFAQRLDQANFATSVVLGSQDRTLDPCSLLMDLVAQATQTARPCAFEDAYTHEDAQRALQALPSLGLSDDEVLFVAQLYGLASGRPGDVWRTTARSIVAKLAQSFASQAPWVLLVDHIDLLDAHSQDLVHCLAEMSKQTSWVVIVTAANAQATAHLLSWKTQDGAPVLLPTDAEEGDGEVKPELILRGGSNVERKMLCALYLAGRPLSAGFFVELTGANNANINVSLGALDAKQALRSVSKNRYAIATAKLDQALREKLDFESFPKARPVAEKMLQDLQDHASLPQIGAHRIAEIRLLCALGSGGEAASKILRLVETLRTSGWQSVALTACVQLAPYVKPLSGASSAHIVCLSTVRAQLAGETHSYWSHAGELRASQQQALSFGFFEDVWLQRCEEAQALLARDDVWSAFAILQEALEHALVLQSPTLLIRAQHHFALWHIAHGSLAEAQNLLESARSLVAQNAQDPTARYTQEAELLEALILVTSRRGAIPYAQSLSTYLEDIANFTHSTKMKALGILSQSHIARAHKDHEGATRLLENGLALVLSGDLRAMQSAFALGLAEAAFEADDMSSVRSGAARLVAISQSEQNVYMQRRANELNAYMEVVESRDEGSLKGLEGLRTSLSVAQQRRAPRDSFTIHALLFRALNHLGSVGDAEQHRQSALEFAAKCAQRSGLAQILEEA